MYVAPLSDVNCARCARRRLGRQPPAARGIIASALPLLALADARALAKHHIYTRLFDSGIILSGEVAALAGGGGDVV